MAALVALLVGRGMAGWLASLIVYGVLALLAAGAVFGIREWIGHPFYVKGVAAGKAEQVKADKPKIDKLTADLAKATTERDVAWKTNEDLGKKLEQLAKQANASDETIKTLQRLANEARKTANRLRAELAAAKAAGQAHINEMLDIVSGKTILLDECKGAEKILDGLADWATAQ